MFYFNRSEKILRLFITTISLLSVISFGHALAGYGRSLFGVPMRLDYVIGGLIGGFLCGGLAMILWYSKRKDFFVEEDRNDEI